MPELAEVETLKRYLKQHIVGEEIISYGQYRNNLRYELDPALRTQTVGTVITGVERRAKYLNIYLDNENIITYHLGMSGRLTIQPKEYIAAKHDHIIIWLKNNKQLVFNDARRFGMVYICSAQSLARQKFMCSMSLEPFDEEFNIDYLQNKLRNKKIAIKLAITDNKIVVGVGNIYAAESLFAARIHPLKPAGELTSNEIELLIKSIQKVLSDAIESGGTTLKDFVGGDNKPGYFKQKLAVYARYGMLCISCEFNIEKIKQSGRTTFFCPNCQKQ